jgi:hypothetical protein
MGFMLIKTVTSSHMATRPSKHILYIPSMVHDGPGCETQATIWECCPGLNRAVVQGLKNRFQFHESQGGAGKFLQGQQGISSTAEHAEILLALPKKLEMTKED